MSIIYDALQKTQQTRKQEILTAPIAKTSRLKLKKLVYLSASLLLALIFLQIYHHTQLNPLPIRQIGQQKPVAAAPTRTKLVLDGVYISESTKLAMINHHMYHIGEQIEGMQIVSINHQSIHLRKGNEIVLLTLTA